MNDLIKLFDLYTNIETQLTLSFLREYKSQLRPEFINKDKMLQVDELHQVLSKHAFNKINFEYIKKELFG